MWWDVSRVEQIDDRRERARLAVPGGPGEHDETLVVMGGVADGVGQPEARERGHLRTDESQ